MDLKKNLFMKLMSIAIAFGLWTWVASQGDVLKTMKLPLDLAGLPSQMEIVNAPDEITIRLRGPEIALRNLSPERVSVTANLASHAVQVGTNVVPIDASLVKVPAGIQVDRVTPNLVELIVERTASRAVPVVPEIRGEPARGYEVAGILVQPQRIGIEGPEPEIVGIDSVITQAISVDGVRENQHVQVRVFPAGAPSSKVRIAGDSTEVDVTVVVRQIRSQRSIEAVRVVARGVAPEGPAARFSPDTAEIKVIGPQEWVESLTASDFVVVVDLSGQPATDLEIQGADLVAQATRPTAVPGDSLQLQVTGPDIVRVSWTHPDQTGPGR